MPDLAPEKLTDDQTRALDEITKAQRPGARHVLSGSAGTGKTTLMEHYARQAKAKGKDIVRQAEGNPVLAAAHAVRMSQGHEADWSWVKQVDQRPMGVYLPGANADLWMRKAFTSPEFEADPDAFRVVCWTNARVAQLNAKIRRWRYGDRIPTPFMPGERALARAPVIVGDDIAMQTNDEAKVISIVRDTYCHEIVACGGCPRWWAEVPSWRLELEREGGARVEVHMPADEQAYDRVLIRLKDEAAEDRDRWGHFHDFKASMAKLQAPYALTCHTAQGSTHGTTFVDVGDIRKRFASDLLEGQRILYTALTRPRNAAVLLGV